MGLGFLVVGGVIAGGGPAGLGGLAQLDGQLGRGPVRGGGLLISFVFFCFYYFPFSILFILVSETALQKYNSYS